jgi:hypothetical protein
MLLVQQWETDGALVHFAIVMPLRLLPCSDGRHSLMISKYKWRRFYSTECAHGSCGPWFIPVLFYLTPFLWLAADIGLSDVEFLFSLLTVIVQTYCLSNYNLLTVIVQTYCLSNYNLLTVIVQTYCLSNYNAFRPYYGSGDDTASNGC